MMSGFLTPSSVMMCPHGGMVQAASSNTQVTVQGQPILRSTDTFIIAGCAFVIGIVPSPCVTVIWMQPAARSVISAPTLTLASLGLCQAATGAMQGPVVIASTQPNVTGQ
jgi:hypothetical protein